jgi:hypothetical protein
MKKITTIFVTIVLTSILFLPQQVSAQSPEKMSYQAVVRDANNNLIISNAVGMKLSILQGSVSGNPVYVETQMPTSNSNGLVSLEIGSGIIVSGSFSTIDWANGPYFIKTETDPTGGTNYTITGTNQFLSVPYALHAGNGWNKDGEFNLYYSKGKVGVNTIPENTFHIRDTCRYTSNDYVPGFKGDFIGSTSATANYAGIYGEVKGTNGSNFGLEGVSSGNSTGKNYGVSGFSMNGLTNVGVVGETIGNGSSENYGMIGKSNNGTGFSNFGLRGEAFMGGNGNQNSWNAGVVGHARNNSSQNIGVSGYVDGNGGQNTGVVGQAVATGGINKGVYGTASNGTENYAGFFVGMVKVQGSDVYIENIGSGVIMKSPNGQCWRVTPDNTGMLTSQSVTCP